MINPKTIDRYIKLKAMAELGEPGERDNAARILAKLREDHPGIDEAAKRAQKASDQEPEPDMSSAYPHGVWQHARGESPEGKRGFGNWEELFNFARSAVNNAYDFASTMANAWVGRQLAEEQVSISTRATKSGNVVITIKMPLEVLQHAQKMNAIQRQAFRQVVNELLDSQMDVILGEDSSQSEED